MEKKKDNNPFYIFFFFFSSWIILKRFFLFSHIIKEKKEREKYNINGRRIKKNPSFPVLYKSYTYFFTIKKEQTFQKINIYSTHNIYFSIIHTYTRGKRPLFI